MSETEVVLSHTHKDVMCEKKESVQKVMMQNVHIQKQKTHFFF